MITTNGFERMFSIDDGKDMNLGVIVVVVIVIISIVGIIEKIGSDS